MKKKFISIFSVCICTLLCGCIITKSEKWEGITENRLKVIIAEFFPFDEKITNQKIAVIIKQRADTRASLIMASYVSINLARNKISPANDLALNSLINETISAGKLIDFHCTENNHCDARAEYDITALVKKLETINNQ
jgi:hypothetical protein